MWELGKTMLARNVLRLLAASFVLFGASGCFLKRVGYREHTVRHQGETLGIISAWYTGSQDNWRSLQIGHHKNPGLIYAGDKVYVPRRLLRRSSPLPKQFVSRYYHPGRASESVSASNRSRAGRKEVPVSEQVAPETQAPVNETAASTPDIEMQCFSRSELGDYCDSLSPRRKQYAVDFESTEERKEALLRELLE
jgi:hypothetical protein